MKLITSTQPAKIPVRQQLLWSSIDIQRANHDGDPHRSAKAVENYKALRMKVIEHDRELVAYADLNLAVNLNDQFEFEESVLFCEGMATSDDTNLLSPLARGRMHSSLGQIYSMLGVHDASDYCFDEALALINKSVEYNPRLVGDLQQTRIYRAINAMDGEFDNALGLVKEAIGDIESRTEAFAKDQSYSNQYLHHLLLRSFWELDGMAELD